MYMNKFLIFIGLLLASCGTNQVTKTVSVATSNPANLQNDNLYSVSLYGSDNGEPNADIAVLLPMTGTTKTPGNNIKTSIETAFLRNPKQNIRVSFYDLSGDKSQRVSVIKDAIRTNPDIIIGPLFAEDVTTLRNIKSSKTPVISFTSDINALGNNVMTVNLIPSQSIEAIVKQIKIDGIKNMLVLAPDDNSGKLMAAVANNASKVYDTPINGLFYYTPGNSESIKDASMRASMYNARNAANTRAREILSDILTNETIDEETKTNLEEQLEIISRTETLGPVPYDAILFLGNAEDTKTIVSFLRYYGVWNQDIAMYGTTLWHGSDIISDFTLSGAKYATLPEISDNFISLYDMVAGKKPDYLAAFGYDAANLALAMIYTQKPKSTYLFDPSGYIGTTGAFRIQPSGESERSLRIMQLNGTSEAKVLKNAATNFLIPLYSVNSTNLKDVPEQELTTRGINPGDYIKIPEEFSKKSEYKTKTIGANYISDETAITQETPIKIFESEEQETITNEEFEPVKLEKVSRQYIDSVEIEE